MDFWNTVRGVELAETLIKELPKFNGKKEQMLVRVDHESDAENIAVRLTNGWSFAGSFTDYDGTSIVVLER